MASYIIYDTSFYLYITSTEMSDLNDTKQFDIIYILVVVNRHNIIYFWFYT